MVYKTYFQIHNFELFNFFFFVSIDSEEYVDPLEEIYLKRPYLKNVILEDSDHKITVLHFIFKFFYFSNKNMLRLTIFKIRINI